MIKRKFKIPYFYAILVFLLITGFIVLHFAKNKLVLYLQDYENAQPKYAAEEIFSRYYKNPDFGAVISLSVNDLSPAETAEDLKRYFEELTAGKEITYSSASALKYNVKADGKKISTFTLVKSGKTSEFGFELYELGTITNYYKPEKSVTVSAPFDAVVYINGYALDSTYCTEKDITNSYCRKVPEGLKPITYITYKIDGLLFNPNISVRNDNGESELTYDESKKIYTASVIYNERLKNEYSEYVIKAAEEYAAYMGSDVSFGAVKPYFLPGTPLYENIRTSLTEFVWEHESYRFDDVKTSEFYQYDENTFSCRVQFTHVMTRVGSNDFKDFFDVTYFLKYSNGKYLIYESYNN